MIPDISAPGSMNDDGQLLILNRVSLLDYRDQFNSMNYEHSDSMIKSLTTRSTLYTIKLYYTEGASVV